MRDNDRIDSWKQRIANEFMECPALRLTAAQAARFWGLDRTAAESVLSELVQRAVLVRNSDGVFMRPTDAHRRW